MQAYRIENKAGTMRLGHRGNTLVFAPMGTNFPFITYSKKIADETAKEYDGKVKNYDDE